MTSKEGTGTVVVALSLIGLLWLTFMVTGLVAYYKKDPCTGGIMGPFPAVVMLVIGAALVLTTFCGYVLGKESE